MSTGPVTAFKILEATVNSIKDLSTGSYESISIDEDSALKTIKISTDQYLYAANKISIGGDTKDVSDLHLPRAAEVIETIDTFGEDVKPGDLINWKRTK